jgi:endonuclease/exonuclease/phosphatase family metal-dependent hydrolase
VALQEVEHDPATGATQADQLAHDLGYSCSFQPITTSDYGEGGRCGLALLSRRPVGRCREIRLPSDAVSGQAALQATVTCGDGDLDLLLVHLTPRSEELQVGAVERLLECLDAMPPDRPAIVLGDFNCEPLAAPIRKLTSITGKRTGALRDAWQAALPDDPGPTMPSQAPVVRIDYIFVSSGISVEEVERLGQKPDSDGFYPSDHLGALRLSG